MTQTKTRYRLTVWADVPNDDETQEPSFSRRELEKHIYRVLEKHAEPDCDCEVMDSEVLGDD